MMELRLLGSNFLWRHVGELDNQGQRILKTTNYRRLDMKMNIERNFEENLFGHIIHLNFHIKLFNFFHHFLRNEYEINA